MNTCSDSLTIQDVSNVTISCRIQADSKQPLSEVTTVAAIHQSPPTNYQFTAVHRDFVSHKESLVKVKELESKFGNVASAYRLQFIDEMI